jgi:glucose-6-phosphate isomerase
MPFPSDTFTITPGSLDAAFTRCCRRLEEQHFVEALWRRDPDIWSTDPSIRELVGHRLGWLGAIDAVTPQLSRLRDSAESVRHDGFTDVVLLGMGGSSLGPEVLSHVIGSASGSPAFHVLDSVDPDAVRAAMVRPATSLFVLASKSGATIEPHAMAAEARRLVVEAGHTEWGHRFVAITDDGTPLHQQAVANRFRDVFINPADIGGRYSALSLFGLVPAALMGIDLDALCAHARDMEAACRAGAAAINPGLALGALIAAGAETGRDKLTLLLPSRLQSLGLWVEQLVAESTGKHGKGVVPVAGEPRDVAFGGDRVVVSVSVAAEGPGDVVRDRAVAGNVPMASLRMPDETALGAEFLRWEVATAAAGFLMGINPFDEPNVRQAKDATQVLLDAYEHSQQLPVPAPDTAHDGVRWSLSEAARAALDGAPASSFLRVLRPHDYFAVLAYLPPEDQPWRARLEELRAMVADRTKCATTTGYGPRYLHSTGQLHKGGPNSGVFVIIVAPPDEDLSVPDQPYSFGVLEMAQALGDFQSLDRAGRRALLLQLDRRDVQSLDHAINALGSTG